MCSSSSKVAGWFVPARGTCSRKLSSPSASIRQTCTPACANASDRQSPTGPAPTTITRLEASMLARWVCRELGGLPLPDGERVGVRGFEAYRETLTPHPIPLPYGRASQFEFTSIFLLLPSRYAKLERQPSWEAAYR